MALLEFCERMTRDAARMMEDDVKRLRGAGLTDEEILEGAAICAYFNFIDRIADAFGVPLDPAYQKKSRKT